ncbi:hypothetical protein ZYGR_0I01520 [Zygosaccharomyces rouxii]|uniref:ZYRO0C03608p n=2 Tax=Zygosaccharomyces rouxii TaxID=4956 RepID=C5DSW9_ZYGRC|nr:uncharacterized protein ZYRO0C03608g [Zygosaccharomyces rouxii]KAH9201930.1 peroxisomal biogenesis factor 11 [Zygosaccharomyces rouxii]GAV47856.1 hypothetical protein ZYGR_0I01520 [Zygosaccharomyces rouxii]CAR26880.1 ZYRO0C03608p [Zygosaccharomyces rouxii]
MVADSVVYHPTINKLINFLDNGAGREKCLRLLQYLARFLAAQTLSPLAKALQGQFTIVRKFLRFLKPLNSLQAAAKLYDNKLTSDGIVRIFNIIKQLSFAGYLSLDQINLFRILRVVPTTRFTGKLVPKMANLCWLSALVSGMVCDLRQVSLSQSKITALAVNDDEKKLLSKAYKDRYSASRKFVWDATDLFMVLNNLGYLRYQEGYVALAGVFTSLFGLQDTWRAAKP